MHPAAQTSTAEPITWERLSPGEHRARRGRQLVGLVTRPARGVFWAHRVWWDPASGHVDEYGPRTRHRTLTAARAAIEADVPAAGPAQTAA